MPNENPNGHLGALTDCLDILIVFAEQNGDFVFAAKLDDARVWFVKRYSQNTDPPASSPDVRPD